MKWFDTLLTGVLSFLCKLVRVRLTDTQQQTLLQLAKFCVAGLVNTAVSYGTTVLCLLAGLHLLIANAIAFVISTTCAFFLNRYIVFQADGSIWKGLMKNYSIYAFTGIGLNSGLLLLLTEVCNVSSYAAPLLVLIVTIPVNFVLNKFWAFRK